MIDEKKIKVETITIPGHNWGPVKTDIRVTYDGHVCPYIELSGRLAKQYIGYETIKNDLNFITHILEHVNNYSINDPLLQNALWESFITKYGRCFADASAGRGIKLERKEVFKECNEDLLKLHDVTMEQRNNFSAHAGQSDSDIISGRLALMPSAIGKERLTFYIARNLAMKAEPDLNEKYQNLIKHIRKYIDKKLEPIYINLKKEYAAIDIDALYNQARYIIT